MTRIFAALLFIAIAVGSVTAMPDSGFANPCKNNPNACR